MATKFLKVFFAALILSMLQSCPGIEEECNDVGNVTRIDNLVKIYPLKTTYSAGEIITYKAEVPSVVNFNGENINVYQLTLDQNARLYANPIFFDGNELTYIKGSQENYNGGWTNVTYNPLNQTYELEVKIKLLKVGNYSMISGEYFEISGNEKCNRFRIDSTIEGTNLDGKIEFTVQ